MKIKGETIVKPLPTEMSVSKHEKYWRQTLPKSYVEFMNLNNGVVVEDATFQIGNREYMIERFLCMVDDIKEHPQAIYDIDVVLSQIEERLTDNEELLGAEVLPIAAVFAGDFVCLDFRNNTKEPAVCVWSHEESGELEPVFYEITKSFADFIDIL